MRIQHLLGHGVVALTLMLLSFGNAQSSTADHSQFKQLQQDFKSGPEVTEACLSCHTEASKQIENTTHWTWEFDHINGQKLGKRNVVNNFCLYVGTNEARCTSCHIGYGWKDMREPLPAGRNIDCLVCHDTTASYKKFPTGAGHPNYTPKEWPKGSGKIRPAVNLQKVAQNVGATSRQTCGACHFYGGGGNGVKHGDMDNSLNNPPFELDVHMSKDGANFTCATCHNPKGHNVPGSRYMANAKDTEGIDRPSNKYKDHASCESCHGTTPHKKEAKLNDHTDKVACQTCHIPAFARGGVPTKLWWDWSKAGQKNAEGKGIVRKDEKGHDIYNFKKGEFKLGENVTPEYAWFDGQIRYTLKEEKIDPSGVVNINTFNGSYNDPKARIWPFKVMRGKQPYDTEYNTLLVVHLFGKDKNAYWKNFDWQKALSAGNQISGQPFSGNFDFVQTAYHWPQTHMVAPKEKAVECDECHAKDGRLASLKDFYMPGRDQNQLVDTIGFALVGLTGAGVVIHGLLRIFTRRKDKEEG